MVQKKEDPLEILNKTTLEAQKLNKKIKIDSDEIYEEYENRGKRASLDEIYLVSKLINFLQSQNI